MTRNTVVLTTPMSVTEPSHSLANGDHAHAAFQGFDWSRRIAERGLAFSVAEGGASGHPYARLPGCPPARPQPLTRQQQLYVVLATGGAVWHFRCNQESSQTCWWIRCLVLLMFDVVVVSLLLLFVVVMSLFVVVVAAAVCCCCCHVSVSLLLLLLLTFVVVKSLSLFPSLSFPPYYLSLKSQIDNKQKMTLPQFQGE